MPALGKFTIESIELNDLVRVPPKDLYSPVRSVVVNSLGGVPNVTEDSGQHEEFELIGGENIGLILHETIVQLMALKNVPNSSYTLEEPDGSTMQVRFRNGFGDDDAITGELVERKSLQDNSDHWKNVRIKLARV